MHGDLLAFGVWLLLARVIRMVGLLFVLLFVLLNGLDWRRTCCLCGSEKP